MTSETGDDYGNGDDGNGDENRQQIRRSSDIDLLSTERQTLRAVEGLRSEFRGDVRLIKADIKTINRRLDEGARMIEDKLVTKDQFTPVKLIAYGFAGATFMSVLGAVLATVVQHAK